MLTILAPIQNLSYVNVKEKPTMTNIWTDGGCRYNPGVMAMAWVLEPEAGGRYIHAERLWDGTNNLAELVAIHEALTWAKYEYQLTPPYTLYTDSALAQRLASGEYEAHVENLQRYTGWIRAVAGSDVTFIHIPREENERADRLVKEVLYD